MVPATGTPPTLQVAQNQISDIRSLTATSHHNLRVAVSPRSSDDSNIITAQKGLFTVQNILPNSIPKSCVWENIGTGITFVIRGICNGLPIKIMRPTRDKLSRLVSKADSEGSTIEDLDTASNAKTLLTFARGDNPLSPSDALVRTSKNSGRPADLALISYKPLNYDLLREQSHVDLSASGVALSDAQSQGFFQMVCHFFAPIVRCVMDGAIEALSDPQLLYRLIEALFFTQLMCLAGLIDQRFSNGNPLPLIDGNTLHSTNPLITEHGYDGICHHPGQSAMITLDFN